MEDYDAVVVGGGPAGLTAAIYLARFRRRVLVVDAGKGRAREIPCSHNHSGYPAGVAGAELVADMAKQAARFGAAFVSHELTGIEQGPPLEVELAERSVTTRALMLCTGVVNHSPDIDAATHKRALQAGQLRYCPICDGYEVIGKSVAVLGNRPGAIQEALFLKTYTDEVMYVRVEGSPITEVDDNARLEKANIRALPCPISSIQFDDRVTIQCGDEDVHCDTMYSALGSAPSNRLAQQLGLSLDVDGLIKVDKHQRTSTKSVYAAGDIVPGLDQISVAMGTAAIAATALHNDLKADE